MLVNLDLVDHWLRISESVFIFQAAQFVWFTRKSGRIFVTKEKLRKLKGNKSLITDGWM